MQTALNADHFSSHSRTTRDQLAWRIASEGPQGLSDADLLGFLLNDDDAGRKVDALGSLRCLLKADHRTARGVGLTTVRYAIARAALELSRRHLAEHVYRQSALNCPSQLREYARACMRDLPYEVFAALWLDNQRRVMKFQELFRGTIDGAYVHPREVVREAISVNAAAVILVHNHPSGHPEPSEADQLVTRRLKEALGLIDIRVIDHLIVGDQTVESFAERGLL